MPKLFERHMVLGEKAFKNKHYEEAKDNFQRAYEIESNEKANLYLVKTLLCLKEYQKAYTILCEKKSLYQTNKNYQKSYFDILIQLTYFFEVEVFLGCLKDQSKKEYQEIYQLAKEYQWLTRKEEYDKISKRFGDMGKCSPSEQVIVIKQLKFLTGSQLIELAQGLLIDKEVILLVKAEIIQQLSLIQCKKSFDLLTYQNQIKQVVPKKVVTLNEVYQTSELLRVANSFFEKKAPSLKKMVLQTIKLHIGLLYPFHEDEMRPIDTWLAVYVRTYTEVSNEYTDDAELIDIVKKQAILDQEIAKLVVVD